VRQRKTGRPVRFELTEHTRQAIDAYLKSCRKKPGEFLFTGPRSVRSMTPRQYGRLVSDWLIGIGLDPHLYGTHSLRRTKATLIYRPHGQSPSRPTAVRSHEDREYCPIPRHRCGRCPYHSGAG
jgi:integrase